MTCSHSTPAPDSHPLVPYPVTLLCQLCRRLSNRVSTPDTVHSEPSYGYSELMTGDSPNRQGKAKGQRRRQHRRGKNKKGSQKTTGSVLVRSTLDIERPADEPLTPAEVNEMLRHLGFIRKYRKVLRPKLNAKEDLLVTGSHQPEHRGTCRHLLSKIDRNTVLAALEREPLKSDARARSIFLGGAAGICGDVRILLRFLETLTTSVSSEESTRTFALAVEHIDFEKISAAQMSRLLDVMQTAFAERDVSGALFGLLRNRGFRKSFDGCADELKPEIAARFVPLRAVHRAILVSDKKPPRRTAKPDPALAQGLRLMLDTPPALLNAYPTQVRQKLLESALQLEADWVIGHPGILTLLRSLSKNVDLFGKQGFKYAKLLMAVGEYEKTLTLLGELEKAQCPRREITKLMRWLQLPRVGPFALKSEKIQTDCGLQPAIWLDELLPVLVRIGKPNQLQRFAEEARLQAGVFLPGITSVLDYNDGDQGRPYVTIATDGPRLDTVINDQKNKLSCEDVLGLAMAGIRIFRALAFAKIALPDAAPDRFVIGRAGDPNTLRLADFDGARSVEENEAASSASSLSIEFCRSALAFPPFRGNKPRRDLPTGLTRALRQAFEEEASPTTVATLLTESGLCRA